MKSYFLIMTLFSFWGCSNKKNMADVPTKASAVQGIEVGDQLPDAQVVDKNGNSVALGSVLRQQASVLIFYRGGWCPYCNRQLAGLMQIEQAISDLGYQIIAISPDDYKNLQKTEEKDSLNYQLYSDPAGEYIQRLGIAFQTPTAIKGFMAVQGQKGAYSEVIPVPTVLIVDKTAKVLYQYSNPNYKERLDEAVLLEELKKIRL